MGWQICTDILQGVYIPVDKKLSSKIDFRKKSQEDFFASLSQETTKCTPRSAPRLRMVLLVRARARERHID